MLNKNTKLISIQPATRWEDAFPIGNGKLAASIYGNICDDTIVINQEELWFPVEKTEIPEISENLPELRKILDKEEWNFTENFLSVMFAEKGAQLNQSRSNYHPACELKIKTEAHIPFQNYYRKLDLSTAVCTIYWQEKNSEYKREHFVSRTDNIASVKISGTKARPYDIVIQPRDPTEENRYFKKKDKLRIADLPIDFRIWDENKILVLTGTYETGDRYATLVKGVSDQKPIVIKKGCISTGDIEELELYIKVIPHVKDEEALKKEITEFSQTNFDFDDLLQKNKEIHQDFFNRLNFKITDKYEEIKESTIDYILNNKNDLLEYELLNSYNGKVSQSLVEKLFYFGRYLFICSSPEKGWPANLQGKWNGYYFPAWSSDYHNDVNIQMNYWAALPGNLAELTKSYFDFYDACIQDCQDNAKKVFGCGGILLPIAQTIKGTAPLYGGPWLNWTAGAGWIAQLYYDHWLFTGDKDFLENRALPYLREVAEFYDDFLYKDSEGKYVFSPSLSPENIPDIIGASLITKNATMDVMIAKEVFTNLCEGYTSLNKKPELVEKWRKMIEDLPEYQINEDGAIKEWIHPNLKDNYNHRHLSHIYGLFPGLEITKTYLPQIFEACKIAVEKRQVVGQMSQSGWSLANMANIYARMNDGDNALQCIENLIRSNVGPNLFTYHNDWRHQGLTLYWDFIDRIFQIDANFGITAAILEMLAFSNQSLIKILPALPKKWKKGKIEGMLLRGGIELDIDWNFENKKIIVKFKAKNDIKKQVKFPWELTIENFKDIRDTFKPDKLGDTYYQLDLKSSEWVEIHATF